MSHPRLAPAAALAAALALAGCPLPQPLPDYPSGTITPPRILVDAILVSPPPPLGAPVITVPAGCTGPAPTWAIDVQLYDANTIEQVDARWFVDYDTTASNQQPYKSVSVPPDGNPVVLTRKVERFVYEPYLDGPPTPGDVHVLELVVSNAFYSPPEQAPLPWRSPATSEESSFETQLYRWVFHVVAGDAGCPPPPAAPAP